MGYYTRFELESPELTQEIKNFILIRSQTSAHFCYGLNADDTVKWYEHEQDMKELSLAYPETLFILSGEGEEAGDLWKKYFKNGKMQNAQAKITFEEFDERKLK